MTAVAPRATTKQHAKMSTVRSIQQRIQEVDDMLNLLNEIKECRITTPTDTEQQAYEPPQERNATNQPDHHHRPLKRRRTADLTTIEE